MCHGSYGIETDNLQSESVSSQYCLGALFLLSLIGSVKVLMISYDVLMCFKCQLYSDKGSIDHCPDKDVN